jgi:nitrate/nitrite transport system substrate-binding protein
MASRPTRARVRVGVLPLADAVPLLVARDKGFFAAQGLDVALSVEGSWAGIRDKLATGLLDAAQLLAAMPIAANLGLDGLRVPMHAGVMLSRNGSSITVSSSLYDEMGRPPPDPAASAAALRALLEDDRRKGRGRRVFAHVFPFSTHHYVLCDWMASAGIDPESDVSLVVIPPPLMVKMLRERRIDGFCVGAPWGAAAEEALIGRRLVATHRVRPGCAEKVLGVTRDWADLNPHTHLGLVAALLEACAWLDEPGNRAQAAIMLEASEWIAAPASTLRNALIDDGSDPRGPHIVFGTGEAAEPGADDARWFAEQMQRRGQVATSADVEAIAERTYDRRFFGQALAIAAASRGAVVTP